MPTFCRARKQQSRNPAACVKNVALVVSTKMQSPHNAEHGVRSNKLLIQTLANHRKVWQPPRCLAPRCRASPAGAGILALHRKIFSQARRLAPRSRGRLAMQAPSRCAARFPQAQCLAPRSRANLEVACIVALHRKVWLPPRYLALRLVPILQVQA